MITFLKSFIKYLLLIIGLHFFSIYQNVSAKFIRDTEIENIINIWANPIFQAAGIPKDTVKIHIISDNNINAFVTNGNNMFINTGLIIKAGSASGLIGVIAHEAGHIAAGHIIKVKQAAEKLQDNQFMTSLIGMGLLILGSTNDSFKENRIDIAKTVLSIGPTLATKNFYSFSRGNEYVADALAIKYLKKVNRNPAALSIILEKLYGQELLLLERQDPFLRTHPLSRERMEIIKKNTTGASIKESNFDQVSYLRIKAKLEGFLESPGKTLLKNKDQSVHNRYARSIAYFRAPMFDKSIKELNMLLEDYPEDPYFLELKAQILAENGYLEEAIRLYKKSIKIIPNSPLIKLSLSGLLLEREINKESAKEAKKNLIEVLDAEPDNILAWHLKSIAHSRLGEIVKADLSAAEEYLRKRDYNNARFFAERVLKYTKRFSSDNLRASDIIKLINQI